MTDTSPLIEADYDEDVLDAPLLYTEIATGLIYEVKLFENFALVRPATPAFYLALKRYTHNEFSKKFREYLGIHDVARDFISGEGEPEFIIG